MTIEIIQFEVNNNLVKVQKKVQCLVCVQVTNAHTHENKAHTKQKSKRQRERSATIFGVTASSTRWFGSFVNTPTLIMNRDSCDSCTNAMTPNTMPMNLPSTIDRWKVKEERLPTIAMK